MVWPLGHPGVIYKRLTYDFFQVFSLGISMYVIKLVDGFATGDTTPSTVDFVTF